MVKNINGTKLIKYSATVLRYVKGYERAVVHVHVHSIYVRFS